MGPLFPIVAWPDPGDGAVARWELSETPGDVLAGTTAAFLCWAFSGRAVEGGWEGVAFGGQSSSTSTGAMPLGSGIMQACFAGCLITRRAGKAAYERKRRSMAASDVLESLGYAAHLC
eukprot:scaffold4409_cov369-Prasinococcus_capsulatus_cf.AAC.28